MSLAWPVVRRVGPFTTGSVPFAGASGLLTEDNANFFWDDANNRLGLGTATPSTRLHMLDTTANIGLRLETDKVDGVAVLQLINDARQWDVAVRGDINDSFVISDETAGGNRLTINSSGFIGLNETDPDAQLDIGGTLMMTEQSADVVSVAGKGQWWTKDDAPCTPQFTDDSDAVNQLAYVSALHAESHNIASHNDTTATGAELETLTDGSDAESLHVHTAAIGYGMWESSGGNTQLKTADDINFANLKAIALVCDNGSTLPTSGITEGQWFLHTPTGRTFLYMYDGSSWIPYFALGTTAIFVDTANGTDSADKGFGTTTDAFATVQFALDTVKILGGAEDSVTITIADGTYTEDIAIPNIFFLSGTLTLVGNLSQVLSDTATGGARAVQGAGAALGYVENTGASYTVDVYKHKILHITSGTYNGLYMCISSNTSTRILQNYWFFIPVASITFEVLDFDVTITGNITLAAGANVEFQELALTSSSGSVIAANGIPNLTVTLTRCIIDPALRGVRMSNYSSLICRNAIIKGGTSNAVRLQESSTLNTRNSANIFYRNGGATQILRLMFNCHGFFDDGDHIDGNNGTPTAGSIGLDCLEARAISSRVTIEDCATGANANLSFIRTSNSGYINCTADEAPSGASNPAYIGA